MQAPLPTTASTTTTTHPLTFESAIPRGFVSENKINQIWEKWGSARFSLLFIAVIKGDQKQLGEEEFILPPLREVRARTQTGNLGTGSGQRPARSAADCRAPYGLLAQFSCSTEDH